MPKKEIFVCSDIDDLKAFYRDIRKDRPYMPRWSSLGVAQMNKVKKSFYKIKAIECDIAGEFTTLAKQPSAPTTTAVDLTASSPDLMPRGRHGTRRPIGWAKSPSRYAAILRIIERPETWAPKTTSASSPA